jgi:enamine deaminase RidA (YjgF/YER057c/UK114 family)
MNPCPDGRVAQAELQPSAQAQARLWADEREALVATLRAGIAEALKVRVVINDDDPPGYAGAKNHYDFLDAANRVIGTVFAHSEDGAWHGAWEPSQDCGDTPLPDWARDVKAALNLCVEIGCLHDWRLELSFDELGWQAAFEFVKDLDRIQETGNTAAEALARLALTGLRFADVC